MSGLYIGESVESVKKVIVEEVLGTGLPNTIEELLERYNLQVVVLDDRWERKFNRFAKEQENERIRTRSG